MIKVHTKRLTILLTAALMFTLNVPARKQTTSQGEIIKTGWNFGPFPVVGFDSDLGFQYGAYCDIFNFGDGSGYPSYKFKINLEISTYTKGSSIFRCYGDFKNIIPNGKLFFDLTYFTSPKYGFYGYNGFASPYSPDYTAGNPLPDAKSAWNFMNRKQFRALVSVQKRITGNLNWAAGVAYYHTSTGAIDREKFDNYQGQTTLYERYVSTGLIRPEEADGGNVLQIRGGLTFDSRDHDSDPTRGFNIEATLVGAPDIDRKGFGNLGFTFIGCHYVPVVSDKLTFAYRIGLQTRIAGEIPYYFTNNINTMFFRKIYTEGLGGNASVRGINRNGVVGNGLAWLNLEFRWRFFNFKLINQNWGLALNPFFDAGQVIIPYRLDEQKDTAPALNLYSGNSEKPHCTAGLGFKLVMNHNMVLSVEAAKALSPNDGKGIWTNIGFSYLF